MIQYVHNKKRVGAFLKLMGVNLPCHVIIVFFPPTDKIPVYVKNARN